MHCPVLEFGLHQTWAHTAWRRKASVAAAAAAVRTDPAVLACLWEQIHQGNKSTSDVSDKRRIAFEFEDAQNTSMAKTQGRT